MYNNHNQGFAKPQPPSGRYSNSSHGFRQSGNLNQHQMYQQQQQYQQAQQQQQQQYNQMNQYQHPNANSYNQNGHNSHGGHGGHGGHGHGHQHQHQHHHSHNSINSMNGHNGVHSGGNNSSYKPSSSLQQPPNYGQPTNHNSNNSNSMGMPLIMKNSKSKLLLNLDKYKKNGGQNQLQDDDDEMDGDDGSGVKQINLAEERVDLVDCKKELHFNQRDMEKQIERDRDLMQKLSAEIRPASRRNFELEKNLSVLDKQIQLLIQNMISLAELNDMAGGVFTQLPSGANQLKSPLLGMYYIYMHATQRRQIFITSQIRICIIYIIYRKKKVI